MDDFDWVRDVSSDFMSFLKQYQSEGDIYKVWVEGISMEDQLTMMDKLYDHGFQWRGGHGRYDTSFVNIPILYLVTDTMEIEWDSGEDNRDTFEDREYERPKTQIPTDDFFNALGMSVSNINESNNFDWVDNSEPTMTNIYGNEIPINTKEAQDNFKKEVNGNYVISTPIENTDEETVLAFGSVSYIKSVIYHIHKIFPEDQALYFGTIKYSKKEKDNVLSYIRYY